MVSPMVSLNVSEDRLSEIAELAEAVADEYCPTGRVSPESIIEKLGLTISFGRYGDYFDGLLEHRARRFHIYCNLDRVEQPHSGRAHFTLGHELGHYFIDEHRNALANGVVPSHPSFCEYESELAIEKEADHFASNLLMPEARFKKAASKLGLGLGGILSLSEYFGTSVTSTALRYVKLDLVPCALIKWEQGKRQWYWLSTNTFRAYFRHPIGTKAQLLPDSPTAKALVGATMPSGRFFQGATTVATWFPTVELDDYRNDIMIEQAVQLGRFGVLTFLYPDGAKYSFAKKYDFLFR